MTLDSLTFELTQLRHGGWRCRNPQFNVTATDRDRCNAIAKCQREAFNRFYEMDAERRYAAQTGSCGT